MSNSATTTAGVSSPRDAKLLAAALLWLRNHHDVGPLDDDSRRLVVEHIDRILADCEDVTIADMRYLREQYPGGWDKKDHGGKKR
jgi:hypothetical protein